MYITNSGNKIPSQGYKFISSTTGKVVITDSFESAQILEKLEADKMKDSRNSLSPKEIQEFSGLSSANKVDEIRKTIEERSSDPEIKKAIMGALIYLDDNQIRNRPGKLSSKYDSSSGDGCNATMELHLPFKKFPLNVTIPGVKANNEEGEWASYIYGGSLFLGKKDGRLPMNIQDSNLFMTAFTAYPLYLFDEKSLPEDQQIIRQMRQSAMKNIEIYKRGDAFNFWKEVPGDVGTAKRVSPSNIPSRLLGKLAGISNKNPWKWFCSPILKSIDESLRQWLKIVMDNQNPTGTDAFFNIPNDADDTAVAVAIEKLNSKEYDPDSKDPYYSNPQNFKVSTDSLLKLEEFRDVDRTKESHFDKWKGENTGAYMTWLRDEKLQTFEQPEKGIIPNEVNLVDEVVNANALFSMSLNGYKDSEGYNAACGLISKAVDEKHWQKVGLYYPQRMIFPYTSSRAFRDGGANGPVMKEAMKKLLKDVLEDRDNFIKENPKKAGAFPGGFDKSTDLSTALGVTFLLNLGKDLAEEAGLGKEYDKALKEGVDYLLKNGASHKVKNNDTFNRNGTEPVEKDCGCKWEEGLFFAGDPQNMSQWFSEAYTTSMVLEALGKYSMGYDKGGVSIMEGRRINIEQYSRDADKGKEEFKFKIS